MRIKHLPAGPAQPVRTALGCRLGSRNQARWLPADRPPGGDSASSHRRLSAIATFNCIGDYGRSLLRETKRASCSTSTSPRTAPTGSRTLSALALRALSRSRWTAPIDQGLARSESRCAIPRASQCSGSAARIGTGHPWTGPRGRLSAGHDQNRIWPENRTPDGQSVA